MTDKPPRVVTELLAVAIALYIVIWLLLQAITLLLSIWPLLLAVAVVALVIAGFIIWWRRRW